MSLRPNLSSFKFPERNSQVELRSFINQSNGLIKVDKPNVDFEYINNVIVSKYNKVTVPSCFNNLTEDSLRQYIIQLIKYVKVDASPGVPYADINPKNSGVIEYLSDALVDLVVDRICRILSYSLDDINSFTNQQLIDHGLCDPVRIFIKNEPHKISKINNKERLIMSVSIVDKLVEGVVSMKLNKEEIYKWRTIPSKPGIGFSPEDNQYVYEDVTQKPFETCQTDCSAFDWSVSEWLKLNEFEQRILLTEGATTEFKHLCRSIAIIGCKSVYQLSNGEMYVCDINGQTKSGCLNTSSSNSRMRVTSSYIVQYMNGIRNFDDFYCSAMGDDTTERNVNDAIAKYKEIGLNIKEFAVIKDSFEFCSRKYFDGFSYSINIDKGLNNLLHNDGSVYDRFAYFLQFQDQYLTHPEYDKCVDVIVRCGYLPLITKDDLMGLCLGGEA